MKYLIVFLLFINFKILAESLTNEEQMYFDLIDLNNNEEVSYEEVNQIIKVFFQLLDKNNDNIINKEEIKDLKKIIEALS